MRIAFAASLLAGMSLPAHAQDTPLAASIADDMPELMELYRDLHAHPELSGEEVKTAAKLAAIARDLDFDVTEGVGGTGVVAVMRNGPGPTLLVRADMDALPLQEQTGLPFASSVKATNRVGAETYVMHACGHDTHMAGWVGTARQMAERKGGWSGTLVMILQPAEEVGEGARAMLDDGLFERFPKPTHAIAFHDAAAAPAGTIGVTPGWALANVDSVDIVVPGIGGHGAYPQTTKDPVVLAARIVTSLQTLVSREVAPQSPAVVTVGSFHAGTKHNIISDEARLQLTVRSYTDEVRKQLLDGIARIAKGEAIAAGMPHDKMPSVTWSETEFTPSTFNSEEFSGHALALFRDRFGPQRAFEAPAVMGGEDFGRFRRADEDIQSLIFWVGGAPLDQWQAAEGDTSKLPSLHSPFWAPDAPAVISTATEAITLLAMDILAKD